MTMNFETPQPTQVPPEPRRDTSETVSHAGNNHDNNTNDTPESCLLQNEDVVVSFRNGNSNNNNKEVHLVREGLYRRHFGNTLFQRLIYMNHTVYNCLERQTQKYLLILSIISTIQQRGGRFLIQDQQPIDQAESSIVWREITHKQVCIMTARALRQCQASSSQPSSSNDASSAKSASTDRSSSSSIMSHRHNQHSRLLLSMVVKQSKRSILKKKKQRTTYTIPPPSAE